MEEFRSLEIRRAGAVATVEIAPMQTAFERDPPADVHLEMPIVLERLRSDESVRVVVLTGSTDGEFCVTPPVAYYSTRAAVARLRDARGAYRISIATLRCFQALTEIEKPIVARVNGDAIGFGQSLMLASDLIVAREDAVVSDVHLGMGEVVAADGTKRGLPFGVVPGDGGGALIQLFMTPTQAKEYMMLSRTLRASELAEMRIINRAVPANRLDAATEEFVDALLARPQAALAWTKRLLNRSVAHQLNMTLDAGIAYEMLNFAHQGEADG